MSIKYKLIVFLVKIKYDYLLTLVRLIYLIYQSQYLIKVRIKQVSTIRHLHLVLNRQFFTKYFFNLLNIRIMRKIRTSFENLNNFYFFGMEL